MLASRFVFLFFCYIIYGREELNKTQLVLLMLFITFVTSVTTGIVTVTLLQQAPPAVTQTINRVVERTIEKITSSAPTQVKETRVIVNQEDQIIQTAAAVKPSIVRIVIPTDAVPVASGDSVSGDVSKFADSVSTNQVAAVAGAVADQTTSNELGTGFLVSSDGMVATAYSIIPDQNIVYDIYVGDKKYQGNVVFYSKNNELALLKINHDNTVKFLAPQFSSDPVVLGQTVIVLGRDLARYTVSVGLVASLKDAVGSSLPSFKTTVKSDATNIGGPLLGSDGFLIGLNLSGGNSLPIELIKSHLNFATSTAARS